MRRIAIRSLTITDAAGGISALRDEDGDLTAWFAAHDAAAVLLRPDFYVYGTARDPTDLARTIDSLCDELLPTTAVADATASNHSTIFRR